MPPRRISRVGFPFLSLAPSWSIARTKRSVIWPSRLAAELANKAIALDGSNVVAYAVRGWVADAEGKREQALADSSRAVALDPSSAWAWIAPADINSDLGKPEETLVYVQKARRLDPRHPEIGCLQDGAAYNMMSRYVAPRRVLRPRRSCASVPSFLWRGFSRETVRSIGTNRGPQHFLAVMRKAGLK